MRIKKHNIKHFLEMIMTALIVFNICIVLITDNKREKRVTPFAEVTEHCDSSCYQQKIKEFQNE